MWAGQERVDCDTHRQLLSEGQVDTEMHTHANTTHAVHDQEPWHDGRPYTCQHQICIDLELGCEEEAIAEQWQTSPLYIATLCGTIESHI